MKTSEGKQVYINSARLIHNEPAKLGKAQYQGGGKWLLEVCDMDRNFSRAVGYELYAYDQYMGYSTYRKTVTAEVFTGIMLSMTVNGAHYEAAVPIPERLRADIMKQAEKYGSTELPRELIDRLADEYGADRLYSAAAKEKR